MHAAAHPAARCSGRSLQRGQCICLRYLGLCWLVGCAIAGCHVQHSDCSRYMFIGICITWLCSGFKRRSSAMVNAVLCSACLLLATPAVMSGCCARGVSARVCRKFVASVVDASSSYTSWMAILALLLSIAAVYVLVVVCQFSRPGCWLPNGSAGIQGFGLHDCNVSERRRLFAFG
jgi:hypothetical protein